MENERIFNYYVCYNTATGEHEGGQNMLDTEAEQQNIINLRDGDPRRWLIDRDP